MALGSTLTSSDKGSCKRRAIDTAPRMDTSSSCNSCDASSLAEYTDAPDSLTTTGTALISPFPWALCSAKISLIKASVSRLAVPLPMAIKCTWWFLSKSAMVCLASSTLLSGANGYTVAIAKLSSLFLATWPRLSTTAILTPWRIPGSTPKIVFWPAGAAINRCCKLFANTSIAADSAVKRFSVSKRCSICGRHLSNHSFLPSDNKNCWRSLGSAAVKLNAWLICSINGASSPSMAIVSTLSWRPRSIASNLWLGRRAKLSAWSK